jgi:hypothetical protein
MWGWGGETEKVQMLLGISSAVNLILNIVTNSNAKLIMNKLNIPVFCCILV